MDSNTICAVSTAPGMGGIAVVRVSGQDAIPFTDAIFRSVRKGFTLSQASNQSLHYGDIVNTDGTILDSVLVSVFRNPHSFTGEDTTEISCHGSVFIQQQILRLLIDAGCRLAGPGEFTQRAFLNGKMDLSQAEAVADVIASTTAASHQLAMGQMRGGFSHELENLRLQLLKFVSLIELELDFSTEDVEFADREELFTLVGDIKSKITSLCESFSVGNAIKNGIPVAIVGQTNVGKSTLLNCLLNEEKAIVSDINGTTRDVIEDTFVYKGVLFRLIDTAGIRNTDDVVEKIGIERSFKKMDEASVVLLMVDATAPVADSKKFVSDNIERIGDKSVALVINKIDAVSDAVLSEFSNMQLPANVHLIKISAKDRENTDGLLELLHSLANLKHFSSEFVAVANMRHYEALQRALAAIARVDDGMNLSLPSDLLTRDIHDCIDALSEITGQISSQDVLNNIFSHFCIGK
ncbi:MAG: tRNA uridine-5-carboxymethylaminomethyl(34) synthesis GTPase MnmE [Paludibacteraceae bacterium]|nr:tRNA uridine-5-carboxymethylaminomethyl(34) synthesis GTPase MnmE [Paludibacteraceae bacterium]